MRVESAIIPTAGRGTRLRPATLAVPKVLLPVGIRPMLDWTLREAVEAGAEQLIIVVSPRQPAVRDYVETLLAGDEPSVAPLSGREVHFVEQPEPAGIGDALHRCRDLTGSHPFAVLPPDNWFDAPEPAIATVAAGFERTGDPAIALTEVTVEEAHLYGNVGRVELEPIGDAEGRAHRITFLQDKGRGTFEPRGGSGERVLRGCARYVLTEEFYELLEETREPNAPEWDDVPAFQELVARRRLVGCPVEGRHFDVGHPRGYAAAQRYVARRDQP